MYHALSGVPYPQGLMLCGVPKGKLTTFVMTPLYCISDIRADRYEYLNNALEFELI